MVVKGIGIDAVEIKRFSRFSAVREDVFLQKHFSLREREYCFSFVDSTIHLAGTFAAKEAVFKALGKNDILFTTIEIRRNKKGSPEVWLRNRHQKKILISISHTKTTAVAVAIKN